MVKLPAQLPPTLRILILFGIMVSLIGGGVIAGWYAHKYYGVSNELAINKDDAIIAGEINEKRIKDLKFIDEWKETVVINNPCGDVSFERLLQGDKPRR